MNPQQFVYQICTFRNVAVIKYFGNTQIGRSIVQHRMNFAMFFASWIIWNSGSEVVISLVLVVVLVVGLVVVVEEEDEEEEDEEEEE